jgi:hypothetical protein
MGRVATTIPALGSGQREGERAFIDVTQGGANKRLPIRWDADAGKWFSKPLSDPFESTDGQFMLPMSGAATDWRFLGNNAGELGKWFMRAGAIDFAGALIAAGLKLQDRISARILDAGATPLWLSPWYYEFDDGDLIVFDNDQGAQAGKTWNGHADLGFEPASQNIGHGAVLKSDGSGAAKLYTQAQYDDGILTSGYHLLTRQGGWDYVKFFASTQPSGAALGGVPTSTPYAPIKKNLYPTLYAIGQIAGGGAAMISYEVRWAS